MNRLVSRSHAFLVAAAVTCALSAAVFAGGKSKTCHRCGHDKHVEHVYRLVKICEPIDLPNYVYTKEEVFQPDKGAICYQEFRSDTFYDFWRSCDISKSDEPSQHAIQRHLPHLECSSYTVCGCKTMYGAKSTGCFSGCSIRVPGKTQRTTTPILKWEAVPLCKDCCDKGPRKRH